MIQPRPYPYNQAQLSNGANNAANMSSGGQGSNFLPNNGRVIQSGGTRILCVADVRGTHT